LPFAVSARPLIYFYFFILFSLCARRVSVQDNSMPVMDGVTATRLLREGGIALPVVGVTGNALEEDIRSFISGGATEILVSRQLIQRRSAAVSFRSLARPLLFLLCSSLMSLASVCGPAAVALLFSSAPVFSCPDQARVSRAACPRAPAVHALQAATGACRTHTDALDRHRFSYIARSFASNRAYACARANVTATMIRS